MHKMTDDDWLTVLNTNLNACYFGVSTVMPLMIEQKYGRIINISSFVGQAAAESICELARRAADAAEDIFCSATNFPRGSPEMFEKFDTKQYFIEYFYPSTPQRSVLRCIHRGL